MSNLPTRRHGTLPCSASEFRQRLWELAGVSAEERAEALREAFGVARKNLKATRLIVSSYKGTIVETREVEDAQAQLRAAEQIFELNGVTVGKQELAGGGGISIINYVSPDWAQPTRPIESTHPVIDGTALPTEDHEQP